MSALKEIRVWVDGSCFPNPGKGGWAWTTLEGEQDSGHLNPTTNNIMELTAPIRAIETLWKPDRSLIIYSDSQYVTKGITEWVHGWIENDWLNKKKEPVKNQPLWEELYTLVRGRWIKFEWVRGHCGNKGNEEADRLANLASGVSEEVRRSLEKKYKFKRSGGRHGPGKRASWMGQSSQS